MDWKIKYRPESLDDVALPNNLRRKFTAFLNGTYVNNMLFYGPPGKGKTTVARILAKNRELMFLSASEYSGKDDVLPLLEGCTALTLFSNKRLVVIDEAEMLTPKALNTFRGAIEKLSTNNDFIFISNNIKKLDKAIQSRLDLVDFSFDYRIYPELEIQLMNRLNQILEIEGIRRDEKMEFDLKILIHNYHNDYRILIGKLQSLCFELA